MSTTRGTILLTGANGGIGGGIASEILKSSYRITHETIYVVRDPANAEWLKAILKRAPKDHQHEILPLDLTSLDSVRTFAADINKRVASGFLPPLQAVILNAGIQDVTSKRFTNDGMERTFEVNYLANFLLVLLLLGSMDKQNGRIVFVGSTGTKLNWGPNSQNFTSDKQKETLITTTENMAKGIEEHPDNVIYKTGMRAYAMSKLLMMMWM
jgi:NAD(P)-dependent dehydrogenase (short-subunit alcohol dehydrogenase family)